jgi:ribonuclease D
MSNKDNFNNHFNSFNQKSSFDPSIKIYENDLPANFNATSNFLAIDTEAMGLNHMRDRLCVVQLCFGDGVVHIVQIHPNNPDKSPNLCKLLARQDIEKIFHFGRFDIAILYRSLGVLCEPVYCTKIAAFLAMTYTDRHGIKELCRQLLGIEISKNESSSYWGSHELSYNQKKYAANDVIYLHDLKKELNKILVREKREHLLKKCLEFLPHRAVLDCQGWGDIDIFSHTIRDH